MSKLQINPVLIIGATGAIGSRTIRALRALQPDLPLTLASRDLKETEAVATKIGNASAISVDLTQADLGLSDSLQFSAMAVFLKDNSLNSLKYAQTNHLPYMDISSAVFELGPIVAQHTQAPSTAPVLMNSNWLAGTSTLATLHFAKQFKAIDSITVSALLDDQDIGGKAAADDYERQTKAVTSALVMQDGLWCWLSGDDKIGSFTNVGGNIIASEAFGNMDVLSLAVATNARNVRFEFAVGETTARKAGRHFSHEIIITIAGTGIDDAIHSVRYELVHPEGQAPMTALSAAIAIERLIGLKGEPVKPDLYMPHQLIDSTYAVTHLQHIGMTVAYMRV